MQISHLHAFAILGPTAGGKTALALRIAEYFPCEIISLDSALIYQNMDIGTAKPSLAERRAVQHHLIDIVTPLQHYSAADFVADCVRLVGEIHQRGRFPLIVGGTMMYYHALTQGLNTLPTADEQIRSQLQEIKQKQGLEELYRQLQIVDLVTARRLSHNDSQRIERALEVFLLTGKPLSEHFKEQQNAEQTLNLHMLTLIPEPRDKLHAQINQRFIGMLKDGFLDEVCSLKKRYSELTADLPSMRCIGYRQAWAHLNGETDYAQFVAQGQAATRQLAKRQLTWLRKLPADTVLNPYGGGNTVQAALSAFQRFYQC